MLMEVFCSLRVSSLIANIGPEEGRLPQATYQLISQQHQHRSLVNALAILSHLGLTSAKVGTAKRLTKSYLCVLYHFRLQLGLANASVKKVRTETASLGDSRGLQADTAHNVFSAEKS
jgi:hypothetical protein